MSKGLIERSILTDIADAIREKTGNEDTIKPVDMAEAILSISGGAKPIFDFDGVKSNYVNSTAGPGTNTPVSTSLVLTKGEYLLYYNAAAGYGNTDMPLNLSTFAITYSDNGGVTQSDLYNNSATAQTTQLGLYITLKKILITADQCTVTVTLQFKHGAGRAYLMCAPFPNNARINDAFFMDSHIDVGHTIYSGLIADKTWYSKTIPMGHYLAISSLVNGVPLNGDMTRIAIWPVSEKTILYSTDESKLHSFIGKGTMSESGYSEYETCNSGATYTGAGSMINVSELSVADSAKIKIRSGWKCDANSTNTIKCGLIIIPLE